MALMILGLVLFFGTHAASMLRRVRSGLIGRLGEGPYKIAYSVMSLVGLIVIVQGFNAWRAQGSPQLYTPPLWGAHVALALMLLAFVLLVAAYTKSHIRYWAKHPMLTAVKLWAIAHLLANGDAASVTLFAAFLLWAGLDRMSVARRERAGELTPRAFTPTVRGDVVAVVVGVILYALFVWKLHLWLMGVSPIVMSSPAT